MEKTNEVKLNVAQQIALAANAFHQKRTGHAPKSVTVVLGADTLVVTLHEALSPAEVSLSKSKEGAAQVQKFHRELFTASSEPLRLAIKEIAGVDVRSATAEVETASGAVLQIFTTGTMVQVFQLSDNVPTDTWSGNGEMREPEPV
jgi:uncharacterized protein YbcI